MHVGLEAVVAAEERCHPGHVKFAALLEILQRAAGDAEALRRAGFAIAVEPAGNITQPRGWRQHVVIGETVTETVGELGAYVPAVVARDTSLAAAWRKIVQHQAARFVGGAAALHGD